MSKSIPILVEVIMKTSVAVEVNYIEGMTLEDIDDVACTLAKQGHGDAVHNVEETTFTIPDELENVL